MASMNSRTLPPLPQTERGFPCNVLCAQSGSLVYATGSAVVVFPLDEPPVIVNHHNVKVSAVSFSPSGSWVASGDVKGNVCSIFTLGLVEFSLKSGDLREIAF